MAKVTHGPMISDARGKTGGVVYTRGRSGAMARAFVIPINPKTTDQIYSRDCFEAAMLRWQTALTDIQRQAWDSFAHQFPVDHPISGNRPLPGVKAFLRINQRSYWFSNVWKDDPPVNQDVTHLISLVINVNDSGTSVLSLTASHTPQANEYLNIYATLPLSAGILSFSRHLRWTCARDHTVTYPVNIYASWHAKNWYVTEPPPPHYINPVLIAGKRIGMLAHIINTDNWAFGSPVTASSITT